MIETDSAATVPRWFPFHQPCTSRRIDDIESELSGQLIGDVGVEQIGPGETVAIAVGSRGIDRIAIVVSALVRRLIERGAEPFLVPAMGSHGGGTAEGQQEILESLGMDEGSVGCPIRSSMQTQPLGQSGNGIPLFFDQTAANADHVIVVNRVKPHTRLMGPIQSGLCKMLMIGLGKHEGALAFHPAFRSFDYRLDQIVHEIIPRILSQTNVRFGIALIEDANESIGHLEVVPRERILDREPQLLAQAIDWMPRLPFADAQLLIVDEIGKEISGTGMDTNVIGRKWHDKMPGPGEIPKIDEIYVRRLTSATKGNASGIGIAEYTHRKVHDAIDYKKTRINCITAGHASAGAVPIWFDSDREVLDAVCRQSVMPPAERRWMWIRNTLQLRTVWCSEGFAADAAAKTGDGDDLALKTCEFDRLGNLVAPDR